MRLAVKCPVCGGYVHPIEGGESATEVVDRTCRRCKARWRVVATPIRKMRAGIMHRVDWTCTKGASAFRATKSRYHRQRP